MAKNSAYDKPWESFSMEDVEAILAEALTTMGINSLASLPDIENTANRKISEKIQEYIKNNAIQHIENLKQQIINRINQESGLSIDEIKKIPDLYEAWKINTKDFFYKINEEYSKELAFNIGEILPENEMRENFIQTFGNFGQDLSDLDLIGSFQDVYRVEKELKGGKVTVVKMVLDTPDFSAIKKKIEQRSKQKNIYKMDITVTEEDVKGKGKRLIIYADFGSGTATKPFMKYRDYLKKAGEIVKDNKKSNDKLVTSENKIELFRSLPSIQELSTNTENSYYKYLLNALNIVGKSDALKNLVQLTASQSSFKGAIGEFYWYGFLLFLKDKLGLRANPRAVGELPKQVDVPIDLVFQSLGFQVKNYSTNIIKSGYMKSTAENISEKIEIANEKKSLSSFMLNSGLGNVGLDVNAVEVIGSLYFARSYNRPNPQRKDKDYPRYNSVYNTLAYVAEHDVPYYFQTLLPRLMSIDSELSFALKEVEDDKEYKELKTDLEKLNLGMPELFIINDKIYSTVVLLDEMILLLQQGNKSGSHFVFYEPDISNIELTKMRWNETVGIVNLVNLMGIPKIKYKIDLILNDTLPDIKKSGLIGNK